MLPTVVVDAQKAYLTKTTHSPRHMTVIELAISVINHDCRKMGDDS